MKYSCRYCDWELDEGYMRADTMKKIFEHERTHKENDV